MKFRMSQDHNLGGQPGQQGAGNLQEFEIMQPQWHFWLAGVTWSGEYSSFVEIGLISPDDLCLKQTKNTY